MCDSDLDMSLVRVITLLDLVGCFGFYVGGKRFACVRAGGGLDFFYVVGVGL